MMHDDNAALHSVHTGVQGIANDALDPTTRARMVAMASERIEAALHKATSRMTARGCPPRLKAAIAHAVFPGGARLRPQLVLATAMAYGDRAPAVTDRVAAALELLHCASLVHDDLPCFDDADTRRGLPTVHRVFDEATALLVGDALIGASLGECAEAAPPELAAACVQTLARGLSSADGIVGGQAWEGEANVDVEHYHRMKTGALFTAAVTLGALSVGESPRPWLAFADALGRAYQAADDLWDALVDEATSGKSSGKDATLLRPSLVQQLGVDGARNRLVHLLGQAAASIPLVPGRDVMVLWLRAFEHKLLKSTKTSSAA